MQLVVLVVQVAGNRLTSGCFGADDIIVSPLLLQIGLVHIFRAPNVLEI